MVRAGISLPVEVGLIGMLPTRPQTFSVWSADAENPHAPFGYSLPAAATGEPFLLGDFSVTLLHRVAPGVFGGESSVGVRAAGRSCFLDFQLHYVASRCVGLRTAVAPYISAGRSMPVAGAHAAIWILVFLVGGSLAGGLLRRSGAVGESRGSSNYSVASGWPPGGCRRWREGRRATEN
jgi:hypothetical protein